MQKKAKYDYKAGDRMIGNNPYLRALIKSIALSVDFDEPRLLPTPIEEIFCIYCEEVFRSDLMKKEKLRVKHHPSANSFRAALELGCPLCQALWRRLRWSSSMESVAILKIMSKI